MIPFLDLKKITASFEPGLSAVVQDIVRSGSYINGKCVRDFENSYAQFTGSKFCVGVGNGLDALRLIFKAWITLGLLKEGDEVILPANTYIASILAVSGSGLSPVFVEPDSQTFNLDDEAIERKITQRTRVILVVHLYGRNAMTERIRDLAKKYDLLIAEDNAQAAGCYWGEKRTGALGNAAAHSFFPTKNLGCLGDGGAVTTNDEALAKVIRTLGNYGSSSKGTNEFQGVNSRLDEVQAGVLNLKLKRLDHDNHVRQSVSSYYLKNINNAAVSLPASPRHTPEHVWHLFVVRCRERDRLQRFLADSGVETLVHYPIPPHKQKAYSGMSGLSLPVTEQIHREVLSLPLNPVLEKAEIDKVVDVVNRFRI